MWSLAIFQLDVLCASRQRSGLRGLMCLMDRKSSAWQLWMLCEEHLPTHRRACEGACEGRAGSILGKLQTTVIDALAWVQ